MSRSPLHILLVDDSPEDRLIVRRLLTRSAPDAYTVTEIDRGWLVSAACQSAQPDCMLLDHSLPDMDGLEVLAAVRAWGDLPIVVLTGGGRPALAGDESAHDTLAFLAKGRLTAESLHLTIQRTVANVRLARERAHNLALLTTIVDTIAVGVLVLDQALRIRQVNATLVALLGQPAAALCGQRLPDLYPDLAVSLALHCSQVLATGSMSGSGQYEVVAPCPHAGVWRVSVQLVALPDAGAPGFCLLIHAASAAPLDSAAQSEQVSSDACSLVGVSP